MTNIINISPPTEEELELSRKNFNPNMTAAALLRQTDPDREQGVTPEQATVTLQQPVLPSRVTGKQEVSDFARALGADEDAPAGVELGLIGAATRGIMDFLTLIPDTAINAVAEIMEDAGVVEPNVVDRNYLSRIFNSSDYESQKVIIPYFLSYGQGRFGGQAEEEGVIGAATRAAGQALGTALPFYGVAARTAATTATLPQLTPSLTSTPQAVREIMLTPYRAAPGTTAAIEGGLAAVSGAAGETEKKLLGTSGIVSAALAPLAAPTIYYGAKTVVTKGPVGKAFSWLKGKTGDVYDDYQVAIKGADPEKGKRGEEARGQLRTEVQKAVSTPEGTANLQGAEEIQEVLGPYSPTGEPIVLSPAEQTMDPSLVATQKRIEKEGTTEFDRRNRARKLNVIESAKRFAEKELTGSPVDDAPAWVYDEATNKYYATVGRLEEDQKELTSNWAMVTQEDTGVYPSLSAEARTTKGENLRSKIEEGHETAKELATNKAKELKINEGRNFAEKGALAEAQKNVSDQIMTRKGEDALSYPGTNKFVKRFVNYEEPNLTFQDWKQFRDQASTEMVRAAGNKSDTRELAILIKELDQLGEAFGKKSKQFEEFREYYYRNVIEPYERSAVIKVKSKGPGNRKGDEKYRIADEEVADAFLQNSDTAGQFMALFGGDETQMDNMRAVILDKLRSYAFDPSSATFKPERVDDFLNKQGPVIRELGLEDEFFNTQRMITNMVERQAELTARQRAIAGNFLMKKIANAGNTESPEKLLDDALNSPRLMRELRNMVMSPDRADTGLSPEEAAEAFRAAVITRLFARSKIDPMSNPTKFKEWLGNNHRVLDEALDKSHVDNMYLVADAVERVTATNMQEGAGIKPTDIIERITGMFGTSPASFTTRFMAANEGRVGTKAVVLYVLSRAISRQSSERAEHMFREMMFNPEIAKTLATEGGESVAPLGISEPLKRRLNLYMFNIGVDYGDGLRPEVGENRFVIEPSMPSEEDRITKPAPPKRRTLVRERNLPPITPPPIVPYVPLNKQSSVDPSLLFPGDSTSIAIAKRRVPDSGIATL